MRAIEATALKIGYAKEEFHGPMNSWKRELGLTNKSWQLFHWISYSFHAIFVYNLSVMFQFFVNEICRIINVQCIVWILLFLPEENCFHIPSIGSFPFPISIHTHILIPYHPCVNGDSLNLDLNGIEGVIIHLSVP